MPRSPKSSTEFSYLRNDADDSSISFGPVAMLIAEDDDPGKAGITEMIESMFGEARTYWVERHAELFR